jgi:PPP family 3-phenylpropionic acid transporter
VLALCICGAIPVFMLFGWVHGTAAAVTVALLFGLFYRPLIPLTDGITFRFINRHGGDYGKIRTGGSLAFIGCLLLLEPLGIGSSRDARVIIVAVAVASSLHLCSVLLIPDLGGMPAVARHAGEPHVPLLSALRDICTPTFLWFTLCVFLCRFAMMAYYGFFTLYLAKVHGVERAGLIWLLGPLSEIPIIYFSRRIMGRIGVRNLFALGVAGIALRLGGFSVAPGLWLVIPLQFLHSLTFGAYHCASVTYVSRIVPARLQSTAQTLFASVTVGGGMMLGGTVGGLLARYLGFRALYASSAGIAALTLVLLLVTVPTLEQAERQGLAHA